MFGLTASGLGGGAAVMPTVAPGRIVVPAIENIWAKVVPSLTTRQGVRAASGVAMQVAPLMLSRPSPFTPNAGWTAQVWSLGMISGWAEAGVVERTTATKSAATKSDRRSEERRVGKECRSRWSP